jgi:tRNA(Ile)-lysidine synthase
MEMAARTLRYQWFEELAQAKGCQAVCVAHHQNDQAETVLLNLKRGTGIRGLAGRRPKSANPEAPNGVPVIRPLLCTTRDYIEHYLRDIRSLQWVTDSTNSDTSISRNAIREQLKTYSKAEIEHIAQTAEYMQGYIDLLERRETREAGIVKLYESIRDYGFAEIDKIYDALQKGEGGKVFTSKTHQGIIKKGKLCVTSV